MMLKKYHKIIGLFLFIPLLGWGLTGLVFLIKPGYQGAYERLLPITYAMDAQYTIAPSTNWNEIRLFRTVLGDHLLVNQDGLWRHFDPETLAEKPELTDEELRKLVDDAISVNRNRYGHIVALNAQRILTDTGVEITVDRATLALRQSGRDTRLIGTLYKIHYLQWLGQPQLNTVLGATGIILLLSLVVFGLFTSVKGGGGANEV